MGISENILLILGSLIRRVNDRMFILKTVQFQSKKAFSRITSGILNSACYVIAARRCIYYCSIFEIVLFVKTE
jgi:hypothetical protein